MNVDDHALIIGGDLNCMTKPKLDLSSSRVAPLYKIETSVNNFTKQYSLFDPCQFELLVKKSLFLLFSCTSLLFLYFFLVDTKLIPFTSRQVYHGIII